MSNELFRPASANAHAARFSYQLSVISYQLLVIGNG